MLFVISGCFFDGEGQPTQPPDAADAADAQDAVAAADSPKPLDSEVGDADTVGGPDTPTLPDGAPKGDVAVDADTALPLPCTPAAIAACDDGQACTQDLCDAVNGCQHFDKYFAKTFAFGLLGEPFFDILRLFPDGYVWCGISNGLRIVRFDQYGQLKWQIGNTSDSAFAPHDLLVNSGGFVISGTGAGTSQSPSDTDAVVAHVDNDGKMDWRKTYGKGLSGDQFFSERAWRLTATTDGFAFAGRRRKVVKFEQSWDFVGDSGWVVRLDAAGTKIWEQEYADFTTEVGLAALVDGFAVAGQTPADAEKAGDVVLLRTDGAGNTLWQQQYDGGFETKAKLPNISHGFAALPDGYAIAAAADLTGSGDKDFTLWRADLAGKLLWVKSYPSGGDDYAFFLTAVNGGGFAILGQMAVPLVQDKVSGKYYDYYWGTPTLIRLNSTGGKLWSSTLGPTDSALALGLQALADGGFIAALQHSNPATPKAIDLKLIRTDAYGHASCAESGACFAKTPADCDDKNACTADLCDGKTGCSHVNLPDDATCATAKKCKAGVCI